MTSSLDPLFRPRSVAVYGASAQSADKLGSRLLANALTAGDELSSVTAVHPRPELFEGVEATASLSEPVDLALISVPAERAPAALADAVEAGARAAIVLSSGFAEAGARGGLLQHELVSTAARSGTRLVGPNCMGVLSRVGDAGLLNGSYFWNLEVRRGSTAFVSQSGAFGGMFLNQLHARGLGLSRFISLGNAADIDETDAIEWLGADPRTETIAVFAEGIRDGRRFVEVVSEVTRTKPVVVLKAGTSSVGARAAMSHTGSLTGTALVAEAAFRRAGVTHARTSEEFFDAVVAADQGRGKPAGRRVAILTVSGGPGVLACDAAVAHGLEVPVLAAATRERLTAVAPGFAATSNPVDLTPQCTPDSYGPAVSAVYDDDGIDGVIVINCGLDVAEFAAGVVEQAARSAKPTTAFLLDVPGMTKALTAAGIPCFGSPEAAVRGYASWL